MNAEDYVRLNNKIDDTTKDIMQQIQQSNKRLLADETRIDSLNKQLIQLLKVSRIIFITMSALFSVQAMFLIIKILGM